MAAVQFSFTRGLSFQSHNVSLPQPKPMPGPPCLANLLESGTPVFMYAWEACGACRALYGLSLFWPSPRSAARGAAGRAKCFSPPGECVSVRLGARGRGDVLNELGGCTGW